MSKASDRILTPGRTAPDRLRSMLAVPVSLLVMCLIMSGSAMAMPGLYTRPSNTSCVAPPRPDSGAILDLEVVANQDISWPVEMVQHPTDPTKWYVADRSGYVAIYQGGTTFTRTGTLIDMSSLVQRELGGKVWNEMGLLGMALHPDFANNGEFFLYFSANGTGSTKLEARLSRFTSFDGGLTADTASEEVILHIDRDKQWHWGGRPTFGSNGLLYMTVGDGGTHGNAQNLNNINGKMIRINVDSGVPYSIPASNPYALGGGLPEIFAYGFRNPWRWSFDPVTGDIWEGDVGPSDWEEVNKITKGGNYGWSLFQGTHCHLSSTCSNAGLIPPVLEYTHDSTELISGDAIIGGYVYRSSILPGLYGTYVFGDTNGKLFGFDPATSGPTVLLADTGSTILSFARGNTDQEIYALTIGAILRIVPAIGNQQSNFPDRLSTSGCILPGDPTQPSSGLIPYDVNVKLWSDGAEKHRWMGVPDGSQISINAEGDFDYPIGTVLVKEFKLNQKRIETRWIVRHDDGQWAGYTFEWNDAETDAILVPPEGKQKQIGSQIWTYPSRSQCMNCHTSASGHTLGLEIAQLNGDAHYPATGNTANQLETLEFIGMFDAALPDIPANLDALPDIADTNVGLEARARGYLHANCAICHRPNGPGQGPEDFRYWLSTSQIGAINEEPTQGDLGIPGAKLITPGSPANSIMLLRTQSLNPAERMPPLASVLVDPDGTKLLRDWIQSMPPSDVVVVEDAYYDATAQTLSVIATSSFDDAAILTAHVKTNGSLTELGPLVWRAQQGYHQLTFSSVMSLPACVAVTSTGGGYDEFAVGALCDDGVATETPLTDWVSNIGGVTVLGNQISYSGVPVGWNANSVNSNELSSLGFNEPFELRWTVDSDPAGTTWIVGLGVSESTSSWRDVDYGLRSSNGALTIYENGTWRRSGDTLAVGDVIAIFVNAGIILYKQNDVTIYTSSYSGSPGFYVDTSFKSGAISLSASVFANVGTDSDIPITTWSGSTGGVSDNNDSITYSGAPTGWDRNTVISAPMTLLGAKGEYSVSWTIASDPLGTTWIVGFGVSESGANWRDVDYGLRSSDGLLEVRENGVWVTTASSLNVGDELSIAVSGALLEYRLNGTTVQTSTITGTEDFYIDTSFKSGSVVLENFAIHNL